LFASLGACSIIQPAFFFEQAPRGKAITHEKRFFSSIPMKHFLRCVLFIASALLSSSARSQNYYNPAVAVSPAGVCAVAYNHSASEGGAVSAIVLDTAGHRLTPPLRVNSGLTGYGQNPALASGADGRFTIAWEQWRSIASSIYMAQIPGEGKGFAVSPRCVTDDSAIVAQTPRIASGADGRFVIVWLDYRLGHPAVFAQLYSKDGKKTGKNFRMSESESMVQTPAVAIGGKNEIGVVWQETIRDSFRVVFRACSWGSRHCGPLTVLDDAHGTAYASTPDVAALARHGEYTAVWKDYRTGESNIYLQRVTTGGTLNGMNRLVNDDTTRFWQRLPHCTASPSGAIIVWEDYRNDSANQVGDIYAQRLGPNTTLTGPNMKVNDSPEPTIQRFPAVAMNPGGAFCVVWCDGRTGRMGVYLRRGTIDRGWRAAEQPVAP
jgi:hypothetical protein